MSKLFIRRFVVIIFLFSLSNCSENSNGKTQELLKSYTYDFVEVDHGKIFYKKFGSGSPIIFLHGGPGLVDHTFFLPQMLELAKDHELIFYDQRGSGKSLTTDLTEQYINVKKFTEDLELLRKKLGYDKFTIIGHSWGGFLALNYAIDYPGRLNKIILLNTGPCDEKGYKKFGESFVETTKPIKDKISPLFSYDEFKSLNSYQLVDLYKTIFSVYFYDSKELNHLTFNIDESYSRSGFRVGEMMMPKIFKENFTIFPQLNKLNIPTLLIHGDSDIIPYSVAEEIKDNIPGAKIVKLEKSGHVSYIENPDETFGAIREFMAE